MSQTKTTNLHQASLVVLREKKAVRQGAVATRVWIAGVLEADYRADNLLAVRLYAPCRIAEFDRLDLSLSEREREAIRRFIKSTSRAKWESRSPS
jgi:hypothetical protein